MRKAFLALLMVSFIAIAHIPAPDFVNKLAPDAKFDVWNITDQTQITFTNGDEVDPQVVIFICKPKQEELDVQYYIKRRGLIILPADFFTIQRYPVGEYRMVYPYFPPARVVYDGGMGLNKDFFSEVLNQIKIGADWNYTITFETVIDGRGAVTQAWTDLIPASIFKRDLVGKDIAGCLNTKTRVMVPLLNGD